MCASPRIDRSVVLAGLMLVLPAVAQAQTVLPRGGSVVSGQASVAAPTANALTITQNSSKAIINWDSFSIGAGGSVNFVQPTTSSAILNRVTGSTSSTIAGAITGNGQVFLVNPNGIAITSSGTVQVGGGFVASTLDIANGDFNAGHLTFAGTGASAGVSNAGTIASAPGGFVGMIGGTVSNSGTISVPLGRVGLGSGERATIDPTGDGFLQVAVPTGAVAADGRALVDVSGRVRAAGGTIEIRAATAQAAVRDAVNVSGALSARSVSGRSGSIVLDGGAGGNVVVSGKLSATGGKHHAGGTIVATGGNVTLTSSARLNASGTSGGNILVGGDLRGSLDPSVKLVQGAVANAETTTVDQGAVLNANGTTGAGGQAVVWSDVATDFRGTITATGAATGTGGAVEVSSQGVLGFGGSVDVTAAGGKTGTLLLDPYDVTISNGADSNMSGIVSPFSPTGNSSVLSVTTLQNALAIANVTVNTGGGGAQAGDITVANAIAWNSGNSLTLSAANNINVNAGITTNGGALALSAGANIAINGVTINAGSGALTATAAGNLTMASTAQVTGASPVLAATGGFINNAGSSAVTATAGSWLIYSSAPGSDTFGTLDSANTAIWNATYATLPPASVTASGNRYLFASQPTLTFTSTNASKTYGTDATSAILGNYSTSGYQSGVASAFLSDTAATVFSGTPSVTSAGAPASASVSGGPYTMTVALGSVSAISGYAFAFQNNGNLTVNPAPVSVTALGGFSTYGFSPPNPGLSATGLQNGQSAGVLTGLSNSCGINNTSNVGGYTLGVVGTLTNPNYTVIGTNTGTWTVDPAPVSVTAIGGTSAYGSSPSNPGLSATGLQNGDNASALTGLSNSFGISNTSNAGSYTLSVLGTLTNPDYTVTSTNTGTWTVNPAAVSVTALGGSSSYGSSPSNPGLSATGLQNGESVSVLTGLGNSFGISNASNAGSYTLSVLGTLTNSNYTVASTSTGSWTVNPGSVSVTALGGFSVYGASSSSPGLSATGLQNGQNASVLTGLRNSFGINDSSSGGTYTLTVAGTLTNPNYTVASVIPGTWTVLRASLTDGSSPSTPGLSVAAPETTGDTSALSGLADASDRVNPGNAENAGSAGGVGPSGRGASPGRAGTGAPAADPGIFPARQTPADINVPAPAPVINASPDIAANSSPIPKAPCPGGIGEGRSDAANDALAFDPSVASDQPLQACEAAAAPKPRSLIDFALRKLNRGALAAAINREFSEVTNFSGGPREVLTIALAGTSLGLTAGVVGWLLRGGALLSALLSSMPLWRGFDPLPILMRPVRRDQEKQAPSEVERLFDHAGVGRPAAARGQGLVDAHVIRPGQRADGYKAAVS